MRAARPAAARRAPRTRPAAPSDPEVVLRSVVVAKFVPWPANSGDKRRTLGVVRALAARGPVTVVAFAGPDDDAEGLRAQGVDVRALPLRRGPRELAEGLLRSGTLTGARFFDRDLAAVARSACAEGGGADLLVVEHVQLQALAAGGRARVRVVDMHNVESVLADRVAATARGARRAAWALEARLLRRAERTARADAVAVVSAVDAAALGRVTGAAGPPGGAGGRARPPVVVVPNAWDDVEVLPPADGPVASFVALMSWQPNEDAAVWLAQRVWPLVLQRVPDARLQLVGRSPGPRVQALAGPSVAVSGTVADLAPWYARTRVALAPLLAGGGSRLKILEALAAGRPVVATPVGAEGLEDLVGRGVVVADEPAALAAAVADLLLDPAASADLGRRGAAAVAADHSWSAAVRPLLAAVDGLLAERGGR